MDRSLSACTSGHSPPSQRLPFVQRDGLQFGNKEVRCYKNSRSERDNFCRIWLCCSCSRAYRRDTRHQNTQIRHNMCVSDLHPCFGFYSQPTNQPRNQPTNQPTNRPINQPRNQSTNQPINQPTNQLTNHATNQPTDQPTNPPTN